MAQNLHQVPPGAEVWRVQGVDFLVWFVADTHPPIPLAWMVPSAADREALGFTRPDKTFGSWESFYSTGVLRNGKTTELLNTTESPIDQMMSDWDTQAKVKPWLTDPEVMAVFTAAMMEGRQVTDSEIQGTDWWRTHSDAERAWISLNASDPTTAQRRIADNRLQVADLFRQAGVDNASEQLVNQVADNWTMGTWTQAYLANQIHLLADPSAPGSLDTSLRGMRTGLDTTRDREGTVRQMMLNWLGPAYANLSEGSIAGWAAKLRNNPDAQLELEAQLRNQRKGFFPNYDENLTYEDIAGPWRGLFQQVWGRTPDETTSLFTDVVKLNDLGSAQTLLRKEGRKQGIPKVVYDLLGANEAAWGGQVRPADAAIR